MPALRDYLVTYDVACPKRWRRVYRILKGYGDWMQLSVFRCTLEERRRRRMERELREVFDVDEDRLLVSKLADGGDDKSAVPPHRAVIL